MKPPFGGVGQGWWASDRGAEGLPHGAGVVEVAFTEPLILRLLPRLKNSGSIRLYGPDDLPG